LCALQSIVVSCCGIENVPFGTGSAEKDAAAAANATAATT
jgi:hypothetical protein